MSQQNLHIHILMAILCLELIDASTYLQNYTDSETGFDGHAALQYSPRYRNDYVGNSNSNYNYHYNYNERPEMSSLQPQARTRYSNARQQNQQQHQQYNRLSPTVTNYEPSEGHLQQLRIKQRIRSSLTRAHESIVDRVRNKCRVWVPFEFVGKYPLASRIQMDQTNQQQLIEICCTGYSAVQWLGTTHCRPICDNCANGYCRAPGVCQCYDEFVKNDNGDCVFTCPLGCLNGRCFLDGSCQCDSGYKLDETRRFCRPICSGGCGNNPRHNCTEPEQCTCAKGYQLTDEGCQPVCQPDCGVGGICRDNNECDCGPGYNLKDGVCQSDCYQKCDNGVCVSRNRCICNEGYRYHERSTKCVPQ